jgi:hypothetical protein
MVSDLNALSAAFAGVDGSIPIKSFDPRPLFSNHSEGFAILDQPELSYELLYLPDLETSGG